MWSFTQVKPHPAVRHRVHCGAAREGKKLHRTPGVRRGNQRTVGTLGRQKREEHKRGEEGVRKGARMRKADV